MKKLAFVFLLVAASCATARAEGNGLYDVRLYVQPVNAMETLAVPEGCKDVDLRSVALARNYAIARLARPGHSFTCCEDLSTATHVLSIDVSFLRSRERSFRGDTYNHSTKTTVWSLDVIATVKMGSDILISKVKTSSYEERRPISEAPFDNNIFQNLMTAAIELVADDVIDYFDEPEDDGPDSTDDALPYGAVSRGGGNADGMGGKTERRELPTLAILKPEAGEGVSEKEAAVLWDVLESSASSGSFRLVSRSDLPRMQEEIGFTTSSDLVNLTSEQRARIGRITTVSKILTSSVGRIGDTYAMSFKLFDSSSGEVDSGRSRTITSRTMDGVLAQIKPTLSDMLEPPPSGVGVAGVTATATVPKGILDIFDGEFAYALAGCGIAVKRGAAAVRLVPHIAAYDIRTVWRDGASRISGTIAVSVSAEGADAQPASVSLEDVPLGSETGAVPSWLLDSYGIKLLKLALGDAAFLERLSILAAAVQGK